MMADMRAVRTSRATPAFVGLCKTLYGDLIDAQVIWEDVTKSGPDQADVSIHRNTGPINRERMGMRGLAITGGILGGALGAHEGIKGIRGARAALRPAQEMLPGLKRVKPKLTNQTKRQLAIGGTLAVADSVDLGVLATEKVQRHPGRGQLQPVGKSVASDVMGGAKKMKDGYLRLWNPTKHFPKPPVSAKPAATRNATAAANDISMAAKKAQGKDVGTMLSTTSGKVLTGGVAGAGALKANKANNSRKAGMEYVPDGYSKSDEAVWEGTFSKFDDDKHLAFGWASVVSMGGHPVIDKQGDYIAIEDIEDAAYSYVKKSRVGGDNHTRNGLVAHKVSDLVESMVFTDDKVAKMGLPDDFPRGWWVGFKVHDESVWSDVRKGNRTGFSIHGRGLRTDQPLDEIMGY